MLDAECCLRIDANNFKGLHLKGIALVELGKSEITDQKILEGIRTLTQCNILYF